MLVAQEMSDRDHDSVGTGILPVLHGQAISPSAGLSRQSLAKLGTSSGDLNQTKLLATAIDARVFDFQNWVAEIRPLSREDCWTGEDHAESVRPSTYGGCN
jgi:hypothetical protein